MVAEKRREIAILLTMGMKPRHIVRTFSIMGMLSGGQGALIGFIPGLLLSLVLTPFTQSFRDWFGFDLLNQDVYFINFIPCQLSVWDAAFVLASSVLMSLAASLYPALRASRVKPAQELNL
nr:FtsX-like permease family protein [Anaerobiospirillum sp. NML120449]